VYSKLSKLPIIGKLFKNKDNKKVDWSKWGDVYKQKQEEQFQTIKGWGESAIKKKNELVGKANHRKEHIPYSENIVQAYTNIKNMNPSLNSNEIMEKVLNKYPEYKDKFNKYKSKTNSKIVSAKDFIKEKARSTITPAMNEFDSKKELIKNDIASTVASSKLTANQLANATSASLKKLTKDTKENMASLTKNVVNQINNVSNNVSSNNNSSPSPQSNNAGLDPYLNALLTGDIS